MKSLVFSKLGAARDDVIAGPGLGRDFNVMALGGDDVLLVTTDPLYVNPIFGLEKGAWFGFQIILSDMLMSGIYPEHAVFSLNLPNDIDPGAFDTIWTVLHEECAALGTDIVSGHTGSYDGCSFPVIGSGTLIARCKEGAYIDASRVSPGDDILLVGGPGLEALASFLQVDPRGGRAALGGGYIQARDASWSLLSVEPAVRALRSRPDLLPGVSGLHDVAEGGVLGAVGEMCELGGIGCELDLDAWGLDAPTRVYLDSKFPTPVDTWMASGQGGIIIGSGPGRSDAITSTLASHGVPCGCIGRFTPPDSGRTYTIGGESATFPSMVVDPFWGAFLSVLAETRHI